MNEGKKGEKKNIKRLTKRKSRKKKEICHHKKKKRSDSKFHARTLLITPAICEKTPRHAKNSDMQEVVLLPDAVDNVQDFFDGGFQIADPLLESLVLGFQEAHRVPGDAGVLALAIATPVNVLVGVARDALE
jgi:hypothetical protein